MIKKFIFILGFVLALTFMKNVKLESDYLAEEDETIEWNSYEEDISNC